MSDVKLYRYNACGLALEEAAAVFAKALVAASGQETLALTALLYKPECCSFAVYERGDWKNASGKIDVSGVYEARVFSQSAELRWLKDPSPKGAHASAIVSDRELANLDQGQHPEGEARRTWQSCPLDVVQGPKQRYLLWGEGLGRYKGNGWSSLAAARIGELHVPLPGVPERGRAQLVAQEYLVEREHGNMVVAEERLVGLETDRGDA